LYITEADFKMFEYSKLKMNYVFRALMHTILWSLVSGSSFYIYQWPDDVVLTHPTKHDTRRGFHKNGGIGPVVDDVIGLYETAPYSLYYYLINRLAVHPRRVMDPDQANFFIIPIDLTHNTWEASKLKNSNDTFGKASTQIISSPTHSNTNYHFHVFHS
jgi:hypothetical protein